MFAHSCRLTPLNGGCQPGGVYQCKLVLVRSVCQAGCNSIMPAPQQALHCSRQGGFHVVAGAATARPPARAGLANVRDNAGYY